MEDFFTISSFQKPSKGDLLISEPFLPDPNFERSVIYLCEHHENGSFGFILNKRSELMLGDIVEEAEYFQIPVMIGGPVQQNSLHFIHTRPDLVKDSLEVENGIFWGGNFEDILQLINFKKINTKEFKFFLGYSGWSTNQLIDEIHAKSWIVYKKTQPFEVFLTDETKLWNEILKNMGGKYRAMANFPTDPRLN